MLPQSSSISGQRKRSRWGWRRRARSARGLRPPTETCPPSSDTSSGPRIPNFICWHPGAGRRKGCCSSETDPKRSDPTIGFNGRVDQVRKETRKMPVTRIKDTMRMLALLLSLLALGAVGLVACGGRRRGQRRRDLRGHHGGGDRAPILPRRRRNYPGAGAGARGDSLLEQVQELKREATSRRNSSREQVRS